MLLEWVNKNKSAYVQPKRTRIWLVIAYAKSDDNMQKSLTSVIQMILGWA